MLVEALEHPLNLRRYKILYIPGNYSCILSRLDRNLNELADRVFYFYEMPESSTKGRAKAEPKVPEPRTALELIHVGLPRGWTRRWTSPPGRGRPGAGKHGAEQDGGGERGECDGEGDEFVFGD